MAYSDFSLKKVKQDFNLTILEQHFLPKIDPVGPSPLLTEWLETNLPLAVALGTEKARSELVICPVLVEVKRLLKQQISLFSGNDFTVDAAVGLSGVCDFLLSRSPQQLFVEAPAIVVVEAKKEDLNPGLGQCAAEMIAAQRFNEQNNSRVPVIYGTVTSGSQWRFLKLESQVLTIDLTDYPLPPVGALLGILLWMVQDG
jgi:hypothetical protein